jgi:hypothetical protein
MKIISIVQALDLQQADAIILRKKLLGMVDHYAIFLGCRNNNPIFVANYRDGVKEVDTHEMNRLLQTLEPTAIEKFQGSEIERMEAVQRAKSRIGEKSYSYVANNCEHFKNWVQKGEHRSDQISDAGDLALAMGVGTTLYALSAKNPKAGAIALGLVLLGMLLKDLSEE